jgi:cytochrome c553
VSVRRTLIAAAALALAGAASGADPKAGGAKAVVCAACHGEGGNSANPAVPSIAAQPAQFLATSLYMFREGNRKDPQMTPMAVNLSNTEMNDLAAYFSSQKAAPSKHRTSPENAQAGPELARKFQCTQCHGVRMQGQQHIPRLAGQHLEYLRAQLRAFKERKRVDLDGKMSESAQVLSDKDIEVLVDYIAGLELQ